MWAQPLVDTRLFIVDVWYRGVPNTFSWRLLLLLPPVMGDYARTVAITFWLSLGSTSIAITTQVFSSPWLHCLH